LQTTLEKFIINVLKACTSGESYVWGLYPVPLRAKEEGYWEMAAA
jgi:hypothetical protein